MYKYFFVMVCTCTKIHAKASKSCRFKEDGLDYDSLSVAFTNWGGKKCVH